MERQVGFGRDIGIVRWGERKLGQDSASRGCEGLAEPRQEMALVARYISTNTAQYTLTRPLGIISFLY
jgi:hypothetical protein